MDLYLTLGGRSFLGLVLLVLGELVELRESLICRTLAHQDRARKNSRLQFLWPDLVIEHVVKRLPFSHLTLGGCNGNLREHHLLALRLRRETSLDPELQK
jgi:hypothetical protein